MDILHKTIRSLSKKEIISYKIYTNRTKNIETRKDVALFDLVKKSTNKNETKEAALSELYAAKPSHIESLSEQSVAIKANNYNKLKNRLLEEIDNSLVQFYFHETDVHFIHSELSLYYTFSLKTEWEIALYHLQKAEKRALQANDFTLLDVIYTEYIKSCVHYGKIAPVVFIEKRNKNHQKRREVELLDEAINSVLFELYRNQNFGKTNSNALQKLNESIKRLEQQKQLKNNMLFKSKLYVAVSQLLISKQEFTTLETYSLKIYQEFSQKKYFTQSNHEFKLQLLRYLCNGLFMNKKYHEALKYCSVLYEAMQAYKGFLFDANVFFYYNALANNYSVLDTQKAIDVLNEAKNIAVIHNHPHFLGYVYLNLVGAYFDLKQPKLAIKNIINIYHHKMFEALSPSFKIQILIIDVLLRLETNNNEQAVKQLEFLTKDYKKTLKLKEHKFEFILIPFLKKLCDKYDFQKNSITQKLVTIFLEKTQNHHCAKMVNYQQWLQEQFL